MGALPSELRTGVDIIDSEHERLFSLVEKISEVCNHPDIVECEDCPIASEECHERSIYHLGELTRSIMIHFMKEEKYMGCLDEHKAEAHKCDHADIIASLVDLSKGIEMQFVELTPRVLKLAVTDYLEHHMINHDRLLASSLKAATR